MSRLVTSLRGGEILTVGELITCAIRRFGGEMENPVKPPDALRVLGRVGISVFLQSYRDGKARLVKTNKASLADLNSALDRPWDGEVEGVWVAIAPNGDEILDLFSGSDWEGVPGAYNPFMQALGRVPGAHQSKVTQRIGTKDCKPLLLPLGACINVPTAAEASPDKS